MLILIFFLFHPIKTYVSKALEITNSDGHLQKVFVAVKIISSIQVLLLGGESSKMHVLKR